MGFKTSELNGILLSVAERDGFPALSLELMDGNVRTYFVVVCHSFLDLMFFFVSDHLLL